MTALMTGALGKDSHVCRAVAWDNLPTWLLVSAIGEQQRECASCCPTVCCVVTPQHSLAVSSSLTLDACSNVAHMNMYTQVKRVHLGLCMRVCATLRELPAIAHKHTLLSVQPSHQRDTPYLFRTDMSVTVVSPPTGCVCVEPHMTGHQRICLRSPFRCRHCPQRSVPSHRVSNPEWRTSLVGSLQADRSFLVWQGSSLGGGFRRPKLVPHRAQPVSCKNREKTTPWCTQHHPCTTGHRVQTKQPVLLLSPRSPPPLWLCACQGDALHLH